jgi:hypothetical protein
MGNRYLSSGTLKVLSVEISQVLYGTAKCQFLHMELLNKVILVGLVLFKVLGTSDNVSLLVPRQLAASTYFENKSIFAIRIMVSFLPSRILLIERHLILDSCFKTNW